VRTPFDEITNSLLRFLFNSTDRHFFHQTHTLKKNLSIIEIFQSSSTKILFFFQKDIFVSFRSKKLFTLIKRSHNREHINAFESDEPPKEKAKEKL